MHMPNLPTGTVTFLYTDIEGSTKRWESHPGAMKAAVARHDAILREAIEPHGHVFRTMGDAFCAVFTTAPQALYAALATQSALHAEPWGEETGPLNVRIALHTGEGEVRDGDYVGQPLNRVARLLSIGHGGQTLLSRPTYDLVRDALPTGATLRDLGEHRLKDLERPEHVFQLVIPEWVSDFPPLKTLDSRPNNLPVQRSPLIGRERELATAQGLLLSPGVGVLTLTGPGGTGKTRLALQLAAETIDEFKDGVFLVNLTPITDPGLVASTVAQTLGVRQVGDQPVLESLKDYLRKKRLLLLLDNFEQVLDAAPIVADLMRSASGLKVLVTSRAVLHIRDEQEFPVPPLSLPDPRWLPSLDAISQYEAVALFIQRARLAKPDFDVTNQNAPAVAEICLRLDGLPLAIELAASRVRLFPPHAMLGRLGNRLNLLTGGSRDLPAHQQTLRTTVGWSYDLLNEDEQALFRCLSVFAGGCTLEAAETVCGDFGLEGDRANPNRDVLGGISSLLDKSLLRQEELHGDPRFTMLETIREYGLERLGEGVEAQAVRRRHAAFFLQMAELGDKKLKGPEYIEWLDRLDAEHDNMRAVLAWSLDRDVEVVLRMCGALRLFWLMRGHLDEGSAWAKGALDRPGAAENRAYAQALLTMGVFASIQNDLIVARPLFEKLVQLLRHAGDQQLLAFALSGLGMVITMQDGPEAGLSLSEEGVSIFREVGEDYDLATALVSLGIADMFLGDYSQARALLEESLALLRGTGGQYTARALGSLGDLARIRGDYEQARNYYEECLLLVRESRVTWELPALLHNLGHVATSQGDLTRAGELFRESLALQIELGNKPGIAEGLMGFAGIASAQAESERAARLFGAGQVLREAAGVPMWPAERVDYERNLDMARAQINEATFEAALVEGRTMSMERVIAYALEEDATLSTDQ